MPYINEWVDPEVVLDDARRDIKVVREYKNDEASEPYTFWFRAFGTMEAVYEDESGVKFDARSLPPSPDEDPKEQSDYDRMVLRIQAAVSSGHLTKAGVVCDRRK